MIQHLTRQQLNQRHQLSHEQIDGFLGEQRSVEFPDHKALTLQKLKGFLEISTALEQAEIDFVPLKGFLLSQKIYDDPSFRLTGDVDLLLANDDIEYAISVLKEKGYLPLLYSWPAEASKAQKLKTFRNQFALKHKHSGLVVELHWRLFYYPTLQSNTSDCFVFNNLTSARLNGFKYKVLNPEFDLLFLIVHGGMHGWRRLKWLVDVHELVKQKQFVLKRFEQLVRLFRAERMVGLYNEVAKKWFDPCYPLPGNYKTSPFLVKTSLKKISSEKEGEFHSLGSLLGYFRFVLTAFPGIPYKWRIFSYAWRSLWSQGGNPLGMLLPGRLLKKRYGVR